MISNFLLEIILLVEAVIIHEIGHYIALTHYKIKYKFKVVWWGFLFEFDMYDCTPSQIFWCSFWGILFGLIPLIYASERVILIYLFMCCIDITNILGMMGIFKFKDKKLGVILYEQLVKYSPPKE